MTSLVSAGVLRNAFNLYFQAGEVYKIPFGPLRGVKVRYDSEIQLRFMLGRWETENLALLDRVLIRGKILAKESVICDLGASLGVYSIWFARVLGGACTIYAFEPSPYPAARLQDTIALNRLSGITVVEQACHQRTGPVEFFVGPNHDASSLDAAWAGEGKSVARKIMVPATTLDDFFYGAEGREGPDFIKIDIEGGGAYALGACARSIETKRPLMLIESHSVAEDSAIRDLVLAHDYRAYRITNRRWVREPREIGPHPDGIWGTLLLYPGEMHARIAKLI